METNYTNPAIHKAFDVLREISADEKNRIKAEERDRQLRYEKSVMLEAHEKGMEKGREEGREEKAKQMAVKLLTAGNMSVEQIADLCELSIETINELQRQNQDTLNKKE